MKENFTFFNQSGAFVQSPPGVQFRSTSGVLFNQVRTLSIHFLFLAFMLLSTVLQAQNPGISLEQGGNGPYNAPTNPVEWQRGNLNATKAHFIEGYAVPYRIIMTDLPLNQEIKVSFGYDTRHSGRHALDFLTTYQHMLPHADVYGHGPEKVEPWNGYFNEANALANQDKFLIPAPSSAGSPVPGQPTAEFNEHFNHSAGEHVKMSAFYGDITNIQYVTQEALNSSDRTETTIEVTFISKNSTVILAFGGHLASVEYWGRDANGVPYSAAGINGSPYHVRLVSWSFGSPGNQEVQLAAAAVFVDPKCDFSPVTSSPVCTNTSMIFNVDEPNADLSYSWSVVSNGTNASPASGTGNSFTVNSGNKAGSFTVQLVASYSFSGNIISKTCTYVVEVQQLQLSATPVQISCYGLSDGAIDLSVSGGTGNYTYLWSNGAGSQDLSGLAPGTYGVTVTDNITGCSASYNNVVISQPAQVAITASGTNVSCFNAGDGFILVTSTNGTSHELWKDGVKVADGPNADLKYLNLGPGSYVVKAFANGNQNAVCSAMTGAIVISQPDKLSCSAEIVSPVLCGYPLSGAALVDVSGGTGSYTITWSNGETGPSAVMLPSGLATVTITDEHGCTTTCEVMIESIPCLTNGFCFYTQGFYGNEGGTKCSPDGPVTAYDIMYSVMNARPGKNYIFGKGTRTFTLTLADITSKDIFAMLPGGGKSIALTGAATYSNTATWKFVPLSTKKSTYGSLDNNLLSQAITFFFNLGWNSGAGSLEITGNRLVTVKSMDCGSMADLTALPDTFEIPQNVIDFMASNGYGNTLSGLMNLANDVLGGVSGISPSSVTSALDAFNRGFDDCRMLVEFYNTEMKVAVLNITTAAERNDIDHLVYPNPFADRLHFEFKATLDSGAKLELFNIQGAKIATLFENDIRAGEVYKLEYNAPSIVTGMILYRLTIDGQVLNGKVLRRQ